VSKFGELEGVDAVETTTLRSVELTFEGGSATSVEWSPAGLRLVDDDEGTAVTIPTDRPSRLLAR
jgi:hypothetical protein